MNEETEGKKGEVMRKQEVSGREMRGKEEEIRTKIGQWGRDKGGRRIREGLKGEAQLGKERQRKRKCSGGRERERESLSGLT